MKTFRTPHYRWLRAGCFLALGLFGVIPVIHAGTIYKLPLSFQTMSLGYLLGMGATYIVGVLIYGFRIPECFWPGKFNIWCASHQLFHFCVVIAAVVHYLGVINMMQYWNTNDHYKCTQFWSNGCFLFFLRFLSRTHARINPSRKWAPLLSFLVVAH